MKIVSNRCLGTFLSNLDFLLIGRFIGTTALGLYTLAFRLPALLIIGFSDLIGRVTFPVYTRVRNDTDKLTRGFLTTTKYVNIVTMPLGVGLALVASPFVMVVFSFINHR